MQNLLLIAAGGAIGASLRFLAGVLAQKLTGKSNVLTGTVFANVAGCLFSGFVLGLAFDAAIVNTPEFLFFSVGLLGSLSTFSTFILELLLLAKNKTYSQLAAYLFLQLIVVLMFTAAGLLVYKLLVGSF
jgi:CrcB protein